MTKRCGQGKKILPRLEPEPDNVQLEEPIAHSVGDVQLEEPSAEHLEIEEPSAEPLEIEEATAEPLDSVEVNQVEDMVTDPLDTNGVDTELLLQSENDEEESDEEDEAFDSFGQRIRASQTVPIIPTVSETQSRPSQTVPASSQTVPASSQLSTPPAPPQSTPPQSPLPPNQATSPVTSVSSPSPNTSTAETGSRHSASIGKGGKRLMYSGTRLVKKKLSPKETANLK